ncbi:DUF7563 family protein [Halorussus salinisoli]|nr:hypothetical protein [Halorussus salinisoli]
MPECENCGKFVTRDFQRVFSGRDGKVHACLDCKGATEIKNGAATQA